MENPGKEGCKKSGRPTVLKVVGTWRVEISEVEAEGAYDSFS